MIFECLILSNFLGSQKSQIWFKLNILLPLTNHRNSEFQRSRFDTISNNLFLKQTFLLRQKLKIDTVIEM